MDDRESARALLGAEISVARADLAATDPGEYYWCELEGMTVLGAGGEWLGRVAGFIETGAHDVMVVRGERERLIPFAPEAVVRGVDRDARRIEVDWHPDD